MEKSKKNTTGVKPNDGLKKKRKKEKSHIPLPGQIHVNYIHVQFDKVSKISKSNKLEEILEAG